MKTADDIEILFGEIGPMDDAIAAVLREDEERWLVRVGEVDVFAEFDPEAQRLRLGTEIGIPPRGSAPDFHESILVYNAAARATGDVVMALSAPGGSVMQLLTLDAAALRPQALVTAVVNLAARALVWRSLMVAGGPATAAEAPAAAPEFLIRV